MTQTAVAIVTADGSGSPVAGVICYLQSPELTGGFLFAITNTKGYAEWKTVPVPFNGVLELCGAAQWYGDPDTGQAVSIPAAQNITIRVGNTPSNPQDIKLPPCVRFKPASVLPAPPTRDQVCRVRICFQGGTAVTKQYGTFPMFGPETTTLDDDDLDAYCAQILAQGFTHGEIAVSWNYAEPGFLMPVPGRDLSTDLPELTRRVTRMLMNGLTSVVVFCAGDGRSAPKNPDGTWPYNDPVGKTYGYEWLIANLAGIVAAFQNSAAGDLTKYVSFCPGYDGVFYGWGNLPTEPAEPDLQPARIRNFAAAFRAVCPNGYLALEHSTGHIPTGEGTGDWAPGGTCENYDVVLSEFDNWPITGDATWQIAARLNKAYVRPPDQPANDDPPPVPFYLAAGSVRGPFYAIAYEYATYVWTRGQISAADVQAARTYYAALGYGSLVC